MCNSTKVGGEGIGLLESAHIGDLLYCIVGSFQKNPRLGSPEPEKIAVRRLASNTLECRNKIGLGQMAHLGKIIYIQRFCVMLVDVGYHL